MEFYLNDRETLRESVEAKRGRGAVFDAQQYHVGARVEAGMKYLLQTDVMGEFSVEWTWCRQYGVQLVAYRGN